MLLVLASLNQSIPVKVVGKRQKQAGQDGRLARASKCRQVVSKSWALLRLQGE